MIGTVNCGCLKLNFSNDQMLSSYVDIFGVKSKVLLLFLLVLCFIFPEASLFRSIVFANRQSLQKLLKCHALQLVASYKIHKASY